MAQGVKEQLIKDTVDYINLSREVIDDLTSEIERLTEENKQLQSRLKFYAAQLEDRFQERGV